MTVLWQVFLVLQGVLLVVIQNKNRTITIMRNLYPLPLTPLFHFILDLMTKVDDVVKSWLSVFEGFVVVLFDWFPFRHFWCYLVADSLVRYFWWHPGVFWWPSGWCWWCGEWRLMARHHQQPGEAVVVLVQPSHAGSTRWQAPGPRASDTLHQMVTEGGQHCDGGAGPLHQARRCWPWLSRKLSLAARGEDAENRLSINSQSFLPAPSCWDLASLPPSRPILTQQFEGKVGLSICCKENLESLKDSPSFILYDL